MITICVTNKSISSVKSLQICLIITEPYDSYHKTEQLSFCLDPLQLYPSFIFLVVMYLFSRGDTCSVIDMLLRREGLVRLPESSIQSENFRAMFDRIRHMSTSLFQWVTPQDHFYSYSSIIGTVQFHDFALFCHKNFYSFDDDLLVSFLTIYLSFKQFFIAQFTDPVADIGGSLQIIAFGCQNYIFCNALVYSFSCFYSSVIRLSFSQICSLNLLFSSLKTTSLSRISEMCFLVGDLASCQSFSFYDRRLISFCKSVIIISYLRLVLASLYLIQRLIDPSSSDMMVPALLQRFVRFAFSY